MSKGAVTGERELEEAYRARFVCAGIFAFRLQMPIPIIAGILKSTQAFVQSAIMFFGHEDRPPISFGFGDGRWTIRQMIDATEGHHIGCEHPYSIRFYKQLAAEAFDITLEQINSRTRKQDVMLAKRTAIFLARHYTAISYPKLALFFGARDHTTVMHHDKVMRKAVGYTLRSRHEDPRELMARVKDAVMAKDLTILEDD